MLNIALFGTSADPPTAGHLTILQWLSYHYDMVAVWASDNPFKEHQTPLEHRMSMLKLLITDTQLPNIEFSANLSHRRSLISVEMAKNIWGQEQNYYLVIGSDLLKQLPQWYQSEALFKVVTILVVPRPGYAIKQEEIEAVKIKGGTCKIADLKVPPVSSTAYREQHDKDVITQPVKDYIQRENLYVKRTS